MFRRRALRRRLAAAGAPPLTDDQLRRLARALDAGPAGAPCVPGAALKLPLARAFRFPDLRDPAELRRLPLCSDQLCCNPYHFSRLCEPGTCAPPAQQVPRPPSASKRERSIRRLLGAAGPCVYVCSESRISGRDRGVESRNAAPRSRPTNSYRRLTYLFTLSRGRRRRGCREVHAAVSSSPYFSTFRASRSGGLQRRCRRYRCRPLSRIGRYRAARSRICGYVVAASSRAGAGPRLAPES